MLLNNEEIAIRSNILTKYTNAVCRQDVAFTNVEPSGV